MAIPTQTNKYASSTAGGRSLEVAVGPGETVSVVILATDGSELPDIQVPVERKIGAFYKQLPDDRDFPGFLSRDRHEIALSAPGLYYFNVPPTSKAVIIEEFR